MSWEIIVMIVLGAFGILAGTKWRQAKNLIRKGAEALTTLSDALDDDKLTKEEIREIANKLGAVIVAFKALIGR